jgi:opacity protein-like surface antigen
MPVLEDELMNKVLVAAVSAALLIGAAASPANAWRGGGDFRGGGFRGGERFEHFHDHDRFRGRFFGGFALGLGLGALGGGYYGPPAYYYGPPPVYYYPPPPPGYYYGTDGRLYPL